MARLCCLTQLGMLLMGVCKVVISPTEDGKKCTRKTEPGQKYCWQHAKSKPEAKKPAAKPAAK